MNVANLQIEGLCLAIAAINHALVEKGILSQIEIDEALRKAEATARGDNRLSKTSSHRTAMRFASRSEFCRLPTIPALNVNGPFPNSLAW